MTDDAAPAPGNRFARRRRLSIALVLVALTLLLDVLAATAYDAARAARERRARALEASRDAQRRGDEARYRTSSSVFHHGLLPKASVDDARFGDLAYPVRTSSLGLRDRAVRDVPLEAKRPRTLLMGDSFTEGVGLRYEDTFAARVEDELAKDGHDVLNGGVASYCPSLFLRRVRHLLETERLELTRVVCLLDLSDVHDEACWYGAELWGKGLKDSEDEPASPSPPAPSAPPGPAPALPAIAPPAPRPKDEAPEDASLGAWERATRFVWRHSLLARVYVLAKVKLLGKETAPAAVRRIPHHGSLRAAWTLDPVLFERYGRAGLERCARAMDELLLLLRARKIDLVLAVYPWPDQLDARDLDSIQVRFWRSWCEGRAVPFVDLFPLFIGARSAVDVYDEYFIPGDSHWNAAGHRLVGDELVRRLRALERR